MTRKPALRLSDAEIEDAIKAIFEIVALHVSERLAPLEARLAALETSRAETGKAAPKLKVAK